MKLWEKGIKLDKEIEKFTVGDDYILDQKLVFWDCLASIAHAKMLFKIGILNDGELESIIKALHEIIELDKAAKFIIKQEDEDCHTAIENYLTEKIEAGKKIHTARSRNDQVMTAVKLYMKHELIAVSELIEELCNALSSIENLDFPGYTHMRKAMPSSTGLWANAFIASMQDNLKVMENAFDVIDSSPLGSAAGYGVPLNIDRGYTAELLGFSRVQHLTHVQNSRGKNEALVLNSMMQVMLDLNKMATDLIMFSMPEFSYFELPEEFCTGSSIMPQKKNPDVLELVRAKSHVVSSLHSQVISVIQNLPSGYSRDFQLTKKPLMEGIDITKSSLSIMTDVIKGLKVNKDKCQAGFTPELYATHHAYELVKKGMAFRDAYQKAVTGTPKKAANSKYEAARIDSSSFQSKKSAFENALKVLIRN
jgi:argininosuccinate lyase